MSRLEHDAKTLAECGPQGGRPAQETAPARQEVFGAVGVVIGYDDDEEAIAIANDSDYGLGGGVFSADVGRAYEMALQLHTGNVSINGGAGAMSSQAPFGGVRRSGYGVEYGLEGLNEFTYAKTVSFHGG